MTDSYEIPDVTRRLTVELSDGAKVSVRRWGGERARRVIISHGNGLAIDGFYDFGKSLASEFEVIAFDLRNHGESGRADQGEMPWDRYIADIPEIFDAISSEFGVKETHGAFHSMSSLCVLNAQMLTPRPWSSLTLFEPPFAPSIEPELLERFDAMQVGLAERTERRRFLFDAPEELANSFARARSFFDIPAEAIRRLAHASLRKADSGWELSCRPEFEASNFVTATRLSDRWSGLSGIDVPVQLILGDLACHDMPILVDFGRLMEKCFGFQAVVCPGTNHFMQLQKPAFCAEHVITFSRKRSTAADVADAAMPNRGTEDGTIVGSAIGE